MKDPIVEEIRETRRQIEKEFGDDPKRYLEYILKRQAEHPERFVSPKPRSTDQGAA
jgi:hypothetical protein